jgi:hypothetical protein
VGRQTLMVRRRACAVSNHEARPVATSFETPLRGSQDEGLISSLRFYSTYFETVCTTLEIGRVASTLGTFNSFASASSYSGSDCSVVLALICTTW